MQIILATITDAVLQPRPGPMVAGSKRMKDALTQVMLGNLARIDELTARRDECTRLLATLESNVPEFRQVLSKQQAVSISDTFKRRLLDAPPALKKRYVHGLVSNIVVDRHKAVISGPPAAIAAVTAPDRLGEVRTFGREWWARQDSNLRPNRYERSALTN